MGVGGVSGSGRGEWEWEGCGVRSEGGERREAVRGECEDKGRLRRGGM